MTEKEKIQLLKSAISLLLKANKSLMAVAESAPKTPDNFSHLLDAARFGESAKSDILKCKL